MSEYTGKGTCYVQNKAVWEPACIKDYCLHNEPQVAEVENGVILPLRKRTDIVTEMGVYEGGVVDQEGNFIGGMRRHMSNDNFNMSCLRAYEPEKEPNVRHETVIFGGILYFHLGHVITECLSRLWHFAENPDTPYKIVFLDFPVRGGFSLYEVLETLGISRERMEILAEPTRFDKVIVPEEAFITYAAFRPKMEKVYDRILQRVPRGKYKKVYFSRNAYQSTYIDKTELNEEYFEDFYRRRGYEIVYPEQLPFAEQLSILAGADEYACLYGTLAMMAAFCRQDARIVILNRGERPITPIHALLQLRNLQYSIVDVNFNFLPTRDIERTVFLYGPTRWWREYLDAAAIPYEEEELSWERYVKPMLYEYLTVWGRVYADRTAYADIHNRSLVDVVDGINRKLLDTTVERKLLAERDDIAKLKKADAAKAKRLSILEAKSAELEALSADVRQSNDDLRLFVDDLRDKNSALGRTLTGQRERVDALEQEKTALEREKAVSEREKTVLEQEKQALEKEKTVLEKKKAKLKKAKAALERDKAALEQSNVELEQSNAELEQEKTALEQAIAALKTELQAQKKQTSKLKKKVNRMENSRSWRMTKPLRDIKHHFASDRR